MNDISEKQNKMNSLAHDVMILSRNTLLVDLRFLDMALSRLEPVPAEGQGLRTGARCIYYDPMSVLRSYKAGKEIPVRNYLHVVMHCVFRHMFTDPGVDQACWDLACDIAVENVISELHIRSLAAPREREQEPALEDLRQDLDLVTAEKIYAYLMEHPEKRFYFEKCSGLFSADDHSRWYPSRQQRSEEEKAEEDQSADESAEGEEQTDQDSESSGEASGFSDASQMPQDDQDLSEDIMTENPLAEEWKEIAEKLQTDLETMSREQGDKAGSLKQNLSEVNRDKADYESFLRKFSSLGEVMKVNDDEFDYIFYTYGLQLYKKMPLVEALEYKEVRKVREFVIAIDTSGSTSGDLVQSFVNKTYSILKSTESFFSKINIHIIQCDAQIQEHVKITSQEEFDGYLQNMTIRGQGGTDFRPVFEMVDRLIAGKEFRNLRGLIYFTDGYGTFPARKPEYETAFVFLDDSYSSPQVPPWAIKLVLQRDEIQEISK